MANYAIAWATTLVTVLVLDGLWLGVVAKDLYRDALGDLMAARPRFLFAAVFYALYPIGVVVFATAPGIASGSVLRAGLLAALFGFFVYATYDLTNLSIVRGWPVGISFVDIAWGTVLTGTAGLAGAAAWRWLSHR